jgi:hypothetical protein
VTHTFTIATDRVGPRRWWLVRVHDNLDELRRAASAYHPDVDFSQCWGCCHAAVWLDQDGKLVRYGHRGYAGVLRFAADHLTGEVVAHELVHAAVATYRMNIAQDVRLGRGVGEREEQLAYIYGELYAAFEARFHQPLPST